MFNNQKEDTNISNAETIIGPSIKVNGNFFGEGNIIIEGIVDGSVKTNQYLLVGNKSKISANIQAKDAKIGGEILNNSLFLDLENQLLNSEQLLKTPNYIKNFIKKEIKKEQLNIVNKRKDASINKTKTQDQLAKPRTTKAIQKEIHPTPEIKKYSAKIARIFGLGKEHVRELAADFQNNVPDKLRENYKNEEQKVKRLRKNAALEFYTMFIITFYAAMRKNYLPQSAGSSTMFYVEQALEELEENKDYYFGACKTEQHVAYQMMKLKKALKSTFLNYQKKLKTNPDYNWKYNYPNTFLSKKPGKNSFSFKNSVLHIEKSLITANELNVEYENQMTDHKISLVKAEDMHIVYSATWYIYQHTNDIQKNIALVMDYLKDQDLLLNRFKSFILNPYAPKKWIAANKDYKPDQEFLNDCFEKQNILEREINEMLPDLVRKSVYSKENRNKIAKYVFFADEKTPVVRNYNQQTYNYISNFVN